MSFIFSASTHLWLELPSPLQTDVWQWYQPFSSVEANWRASLNHLCLYTVLPWLRQEQGSAMVHTQELPAIWEIVNGTPVNTHTIRMVLLPSEDIDISELRIPQEWIDIPQWIADYYLAIQVNLRERWLRIWGYTTHQQVKQQGIYSAIDRTYSLDEMDLSQNLNALWVTQRFCPDEATRAAIAPLPDLPQIQAENLIQRLGNPSVVFPRLAIPFPMWGALVQNDRRRQQLYQQRVGIGNPLPAIIHLSRWFENWLEVGWYSLDELSPILEPVAVRMRQAAQPSGTVQRVKMLPLGAAPASPIGILWVGLTTTADGRITVQIQLHPSPGNTYLPRQIGLTLRSQTGEILQRVESGEQDYYIQIPQFRCSPGFHFSLEVSGVDFSTAEEFRV